MTDALLRLDQVGKEFRNGSARLVALEDVSFDVQSGEFLTVVGPSGCGKSTLLGIIAGLTSPTAGSLARDPAVDRRGGIGMVFQDPVLLPWRTVVSNVLVPAEVLHLQPQEARSRAHELLQLVGLAGFADVWPHQLSGGMQQRTSICRALLSDPPLLLMDEPFGALDAITRERMNLELQRIWSTATKTVVFVTHSIEEAILLSDRIVIMTSRPGRLAEIVVNELPRPRTIDTMATALFGDYAHHIRHLLI